MTNRPMRILMIEDNPGNARLLRYATERKHAKDKLILYREIFVHSIEALRATHDDLERRV